MSNNADIAIEAMRKTQEYVFDKNASPNSVFNRIEQDILRVQKASKELNAVYGQINRIINVLNEKGMFNTDVIAAFTGLSKTDPRVIALDGKIKEAQDLNVE